LIHLTGLAFIAAREKGNSDKHEYILCILIKKKREKEKAKVEEGRKSEALKGLDSDLFAR